MDPVCTILIVFLCILLAVLIALVVLLVVPGIRPKGVASNEQHRFLTPGEAVRRGADLIVVGRPILAAEDPLESTKNILREIEGYL